MKKSDTFNSTQTASFEAGKWFGRLTIPSRAEGKSRHSINPERSRRTDFVLGSELAILEFYEVASGTRKVVLGKAGRQRIQSARKALEKLMAGQQPIYGVNTGFGELASQRIPSDKCKQLQINLVRSHACGVGNPMSRAGARGLMFLRANELARGHSGVRPEVVETIAGCLNSGIVPYIPEKGSVGASGDLAPSAHAALVLIGEGRARIEKNGRSTGWLSGKEALRRCGIAPLSLAEKEGLGLINGTQAMQSLGALAIIDALKVWYTALGAGAMTLEALKGTPSPFREEIHELKPHTGQMETAGLLLKLLEDSEIRNSHEAGDLRVQDPYSLRCMPQVHGAVRDILEYAVKTIETEFSSVTDNPVMIKSDRGWEIVSGGNFHGQAISMAFDCACNAMTVLGNISERRIFQLVSDSTGILPPFLAADPGLESGFMIAQCTAAALASDNKVLAHPSSADSIPTSGNKEDFVSMGMGAALKLSQVVKNASYITAIEILAGAKAVELHAPLKPGKGVRKMLAGLRRIVPATNGDRELSGAIEKTAQAVLNGYLIPF